MWAVIQWCGPVLTCLIFSALARRRIGLCESWIVFEALGYLALGAVTTCIFLNSSCSRSPGGGSVTWCPSSAPGIMVLTPGSAPCIVALTPESGVAFTPRSAMALTRGSAVALTLGSGPCSVAFAPRGAPGWSSFSTCSTSSLWHVLWAERKNKNKK